LNIFLALNAKCILYTYFRQSDQITTSMKRLLYILTAIIAVSFELNAQSTVTFLVNMQGQTISANGVHIAGSFQSPAWQPGATAMSDANGDGIYEYTQVLPTGVPVQFKFVNGNAWGQDEAAPAACGAPNGFGGFNRTITPTANELVYGPVCFASCEDCAAPASANVTFAVNMSQQTVNPNGVNIIIIPQFGALISAPLSDADGDNVYIGNVELDTNQNIYYRFQNGLGEADAETVPMTCANMFMGMPYRFLDFGNTAVVLDPVCFGECANCVNTTPTIDVTFQVNMSEQTVSPEGVHIAGNFQGWNPTTTTMSDEDSDGIYAVTVQVDANSNLSYKFINGNAWSAAEVVPSACGLPDGQGGVNRIVETGAINVIVPPVCFGACENCAAAPEMVDVLFLVNMANEVVSASGVHVVGNIQGWAPGETPMTDADADGIYEVTLSAEVGSVAEFRFLNGTEWVDSELVPSECGVDNGFGEFNRTFLVGEVGNVYGPICFGECANCESVVEPTTVDVKFRVNMANVSVSADGVFIAGSFQNWQPGTSAMTDLNADGIYEITAAIPENSEITYKFLNGTTFTTQEGVPADCGVDNGLGGYDRIMQVGSVDTTLDVICFGSCADCLPEVFVVLTLQVDMSNQVVTNDEVYIAGTFNDWSATESLMIPLGNGIYQLPIVVNAGDLVSYKFINGTTWETVPMECGTSDGFGGYNRSFTAPSANEEYTPVCFNECAACVVEPTVMLTLTVNMTDVAVDPMGVYVAGSFNNFSPNATMMEQVSGGIYSATVEVGQNQQILYKFLNGNDFAGVESVPFECGVNDGFGGYNRSITTNASDITLPTVCFSSCANCVLSVNENESMLVSVYPNPAREFLTITAQSSIRSLEIIDAFGRVLFAQSNLGNVHVVDTSLLAKGMYHLRLNGAVSQRVIVE
jgi:1,4-alpha-glucan branching enzyme